jgi:hypothetical protein
MDFAVLYHWRVNTTGAESQNLRRLFMAWEPPAGVKLISHYYFVRGGGIAIVNTSEVGALYEALAPFRPSVVFDIEPVLSIVEAIAISMDVDEWAGRVAPLDAKAQAD